MSGRQKLKRGRNRDGIYACNDTNRSHNCKKNHLVQFVLGCNKIALGMQMHDVT